MLVIFSTCIFVHCKYNSLKKLGPADIFRGIMVSLYVKGKENGHVQAYAPTGAMVLKWRNSLTSKLDGYPVTSKPHLWRQACSWFSITIYALAKSGQYEKTNLTHCLRNISIVPKNLYLCRVKNNATVITMLASKLWLAEKFVPLQGKKQLKIAFTARNIVVISWKICTFAG